MDPLLPSIRTSNNLFKFITFDVDTLLHQPYWSIFEDKTGRQLFWNSYLKSALFGHFTWPAPWLAGWLNINLVLLVLYAVAGSLLSSGGADRRFTQICIAIALFAQLCNRLLIATVVTHDARMTFPVLVPFIALLGQVTEDVWKAYPAFAEAGFLLLISFAGGGLCFMLQYAGML
ncbi:MAG: hypothetical protein JO089_07620 [Alphaproteobacteria bacterium]|nr:hypothetical protein [Alphaproteobacteria bacterium]